MPSRPGTAVTEATRAATAIPRLSALAHAYTSVRTINGAVGDLRVAASPGRRARVRITNTDNAPMTVWTGSPYRVLAIDGTDLQGPTEVGDRSLSLAAGARADLQITVPTDGQAARVQLSKATACDPRPERRPHRRAAAADR